MTDPDEAELSALLRQGRSSIPRPSPEFEARVIRAYEKRFANRAAGRWFFRVRFAVSLPIGLVAVAALLALGFAMGEKFRSSAGPPEIVQKGPGDPMSGSTDENPTNRVARLLGGFQVVMELRPRVIGGANEGR